MEYEQVKEWLDNLVRIYKEADTKYLLGNSIRATLSPGTVLIFEGIDIVADTMGIQLIERETGPEYMDKYCYSFVYQDVEFVHF